MVFKYYVNFAESLCTFKSVKSIQDFGWWYQGKEIRPELKVEFMSSEESVTEEVATDQKHSSESDTGEIYPSWGRPLAKPRNAENCR